MLTKMMIRYGLCVLATTVLFCATLYARPASATTGSTTVAPFDMTVPVHLSNSAAMPDDDSLRVDLSVHEWEHRLLLVFAPSLDSDAWVEQQEMWSRRRDGFADRDLRMYIIGGEDAGQFYASPDGEPRPIQAASARALRDRFDVAPSDYAVVLVGKDGTEKRRDQAPVDADAIFETIDAMPMRRAEMREDG